MPNALTLNGLLIAPQCLGDEMICTRAYPYHIYVNGKKTDEIAGTKYCVVLPVKNFSMIWVKVPGEQKLTLADNDYMPVSFDNLQLKLYYDSEKRLQLSATATAVYPA